MPRRAGNSVSRSDADLPPARLTGHALGEAAQLVAYLLPYRMKFVAALLALFFSSLLGLAFPYMAGKLVDATLLAEGAAPQRLLQGDINGIALVLLLALALQALLSFFHSVTLAAVGRRSLADLRGDTYARLIRLPMAFYAQRRVGELTSRISADLAQIEDTLIGTVPQFLRQLATG
jgi:ABC-type multidrug transport system fused ATPase/permease subunit